MTEVFVGAGLLRRLPGLLRSRVPRRRVSIVVDAALGGAGRRLAGAFRAADWKAPMALLPAGEGAKSLKALAGIDRKSTRLNSSHIQKSRMPSSA